MQVGVDRFAGAFEENIRAVDPAERLRQLRLRYAKGSGDA
jgi:hypothetical protein